MAIKQISVFVENKPGTLYDVLKVMADAGVNMRAMNVADTKEFGVLRLVAANPEEVKKVLGQETIVITTDVIAVEMADKVGSLRDIVKVLADEKVNIEYAYAFTTPTKEGAYTVIRVDDVTLAEKALSGKGYALLNQGDIDRF